MADGAALEAVRGRIAAIQATRPAGVTHGPAAHGDGVVPFEVAGEPAFVTMRGGTPQAVELGDAGADWAIVVDDWKLVVPRHESRALGSLAGCGLRLGGEMVPLPTRFEADRYTPERFPERIPKAQLFMFNEQHGTPVGSLRFSVLFEDGAPRWVGDDPECEPGVPRMAMAYAWPLYWDYRLRRVPQIRVTNGASIEGHWKDLYTLHGLQDHEGFFRNVAEYPRLPALLTGYCWMLVAASGI